MKDSTKKVLLIGGSILVLGGIGYYFYYTSKKKKEKAAAEAAAAAAAAAAEASALASQQQQQGGGSTPSGGGVNLSAPTELNTTDKIKAFQDWMDTIGPWVKNASGKYEKLNKGVGYGNFGPSTQSAWNGYKDRYLSTSANTSEYNKFLSLVKEAQIKRNSDGQYAVVALSNNRFIELYPNGRFWYNGLVPVGATMVPKNLSKGNYSNGGKKMVVTEGLKNGSTFETTSFWSTVALLK
jgi:hypothetical protein